MEPRWPDGGSTPPSKRRLLLFWCTGMGFLFVLLAFFIHKKPRFTTVACVVMTYWPFSFSFLVAEVCRGGFDLL